MQLSQRAMSYSPSCWKLQFAQRKRFSRQVLIALVTAVFLSPSLSAIEIGDQVQFERAGQTFSGKIVGIRPGGTYVEVEAMVGGMTRKVIVTTASVTPISNPNVGGMRTWSDSSGQFRIQATLESQTAFDIVLRRPDGTTIKVPLEKLSIADQEYVAGLDGGSDGNPFELGRMGPAAAAGGSQSGTVPSAGASALPTPVAFPKNAAVSIQKLAPPEGIAADPSPLDFSQISNASMGLPEPEGREDIGRPMVIGPTGTQLCYTARSPRGGQEVYTKVYLIDGEKRTTRQVARLDGASVWACAADPSSGDVLGVVMKPGDDKSRSLCVLSGIREGSPRVVAHWRMFPSDENKTDYVRFRKLLGNQVVVVVYGGQVHAFDYGAGREIWTLPSKMFNEPAITPGGRFVAIADDGQCAILETKTGQQIGSIPMTAKGPVSLGFSADGLRLAVAHGNQVQIFDLGSGQELLLHEANVGLASSGKPVLWLENDFLLLPTGVLLNVERNVIVWKYQIDQDAVEFTDLDHHGLLTFKGRNSTSIVRLPHEAARAAAERDTSDITAVRTGDSLAIAANASGPGISSGDLKQWLSRAAESAGYRVADGSPTQLAATITRGKTQTESYRIIGRGFATEEVSFTPYISKVEIRQNGTTLWQQSRSSGLPFMIPGDKTLQEAARDNEKPDANFFQNIQLPRQILKPEFQNGFGSSRVSDQGIADMGR